MAKVVRFTSLIGALLTVTIIGATTTVQAAPPLLEIRVTDAQASLEESAVAQVAAVSGVARVERYLIIPGGEDHAVIGVESDVALRFISEGKVYSAARIEAGRGLRPGDAGQRVAVVGMPAGMGGMGGMAGMEIPSTIGSSFEVKAGFRVRLVGRFTVSRAGKEHFIFLPLDVAQRAYDRQGRVTHLYVSLAPAANLEQVKRELEAVLGAKATVVVR